MSVGPRAHPEPPLRKPVARENVYPMLVPSNWFESTSGFRGPLGHGVEITLVDAGNEFVRSLRQEDLDSLGDEEAVMSAAIDNLEGLAQQRKVGMRAFVQGPEGRPFLMFGGHWAAATCLLLPGLHALAARALGTEAICASIPHRAVMILFPEGDAPYRAAMRQLILEKESNRERPLTFELFRVTEFGVTEFCET